MEISLTQYDSIHQQIPNCITRPRNKTIDFNSCTIRTKEVMIVTWSSFPTAPENMWTNLDTRRLTEILSVYINVFQWLSWLVSAQNVLCTIDAVHYYGRNYSSNMFCNMLGWEVFCQILLNAPSGTVFSTGWILKSHLTIPWMGRNHYYCMFHYLPF